MTRRRSGSNASSEVVGQEWRYSARRAAVWLVTGLVAAEAMAALARAMKVQWLGNTIHSTVLIAIFVASVPAGIMCHTLSARTGNWRTSAMCGGGSVVLRALVLAMATRSSDAVPEA